MAFKNFTSLVKFCHQYNLEQQTTGNLFQSITLPLFEISQRLKEDLEEAKQYPLYTEKAKSELIITPILKELKRKNPSISLFSGFALAVEEEPELCGHPDFVLSSKPNLVEIERPIFCLVESKNKAPDEGFAQCAAEMYAARLFNKETGEEQHTITYGAVTNSFEWVFLKLEGRKVFVDAERYYLNQVTKILSILQWMVKQYV